MASSVSWQECLIEAVKKRPILADRSHPNFHGSRNMKIQAWEEVVEELKDAGYSSFDGGKSLINVEIAVAKWYRMRDNFKKSLNRLEAAVRAGRTGSDIPHTYKYYQQMQWLLDVNGTRNELITRFWDDPSNAQLEKAGDMQVSSHLEDDYLANIASEPVTKSAKLSKSKVLSMAKGSARGEAGGDSCSSTAPYSRRQAHGVTEKSSADEIFGEMIVGLLVQFPDGYEKERLKLDIHKLLVERKHTVALARQCQGQLTDDKSSTD